MSIGVNTVSVAVVAASTVISLALAFRGNRHLRENSPEVQPFVWGYFMGWFTLITLGVGLVLMAAFGTLSHRSDVHILSLIPWAVAFAALCITAAMTLRRQRWGLVALSFLMLNPVIWLVNVFYLRRRWDELRVGPVRNTATTDG